MRQRKIWWCLTGGLLLLGTAFLLWRPARPPTREIAAPAGPAPSAFFAAVPTPTASAGNRTQTTATAVKPATRLAHQVSNTPADFKELLRNERAVLLRNALIDTARPLELNIPPEYRAPSNATSYIVQSRGPLTEAILRELQAAVQAAGGRLVPHSYYPNNAFLVRLPPERVQALRASPVVTAVLPFEPYYKLDERLFNGRFAQFRVLGFPGEEAALTQALRDAGARVVAEEPSQFGTIFTVDGAGTDVPTLARIDSLQLIEPRGLRVAANDLVRVAVGVSADTSTTTNYLNLSGSNVLVNVNDTGFDINHPDLAPRITVDAAGATLDPSGHGTFVAGVIASSGVNSSSLQAAGSPTNSNHRGMAPAARIFGVRAVGSDDQSDADLQEAAASADAPISNNSWNYPGAFSYDLAAASFDAAVRDARPYQTGSQPVLFVFSAGSSGFGNNNGLGGESGSVASPATSKNSIAVGASELPRNITNETIRTVITGTNSTSVTNQPWLPTTDSSDQVSATSSRGNIGAGIEGPLGRFKPDVVAPSVFTVSTRSDDWDTGSYFNPTNFTANRFRFQLLAPGEKANYSIFVPGNAVQLIVQVLTNSLSPLPFPGLPIFVRQAGIPTPAQFDVVRTNLVSLPPHGALNPVATTWFYSVLNTTTNEISVDVRTLLGTTNELGNYYQVLSNLNETLDPAHLYRYESGSSVAAPVVSGVLALMEEFFEQRLQPRYSPTSRPSPALLKALVINGARSLGPNYNLSPYALINHEGWGLVNLTNSLPPAISNVFTVGQTDTPIMFYDQSPTNALTTGQSRSWQIKMAEEARIQPLRVTLVWTDPAGNPAAGPKLVNDLDLVVTNLDNGDAYFGNDIPDGQDFTQPMSTNAVPLRDVINNVENVFLREPLGSNYTVTVVARRVNVNAVSAQTNGIAQDFALVISSGDGGTVSNAFKVTDNQTVVFTNEPHVTIVQSNGVPLLNQRVGANHPLVTSTNGTTNQWRFYIYTNATTFTNVAFVTFLPPTLSVPRIGVREVTEANATRIEADLDLYVSTDPSLLQLNPAALAAARKSRGRQGTESVVFTDAVRDQVFYVGVKAEDQMAAEFGFLPVSSELPFSVLDAEGNQIIRGLSLPVEIPDGSPSEPGGTFVFGIAVYPMEIRKVVVNNILTHESMGDLLGNLSHGQQFVVLNNHRPARVGSGLVSELNIYDDSGEFPIPGAIPSDGPGSLRGFVGEEATGVWLFSIVDNTLNLTGRVDELSIRIAPVFFNNLTNVTIPARSFVYDVINVPPEATNLTVTIGNNSGPLELYLRKGLFPTQTEYDKFTVIPAGGGSLSLTLFDIPPLTAGRYYIGIYNPNFTEQKNVHVSKTLGLAANPVSSGNFLGGGQTPLLDDAVSRSYLTVTNDEKIARAEVGVIIEHPRVADLALTLISPGGKRILLAENRGGLTTAGYGQLLFATNVAPASSTGGPAVNTNIIDAAANSGTLFVDYTFYEIPDQMQVFYDGVKIWDTGLVSGTNLTFTVNFGPGSATDLTIIMNPTNNANPNTVWDYTATVVSSLGNFTIFSDNTNRTTTPIKFATPPFAPAVAPPVEILISGFEVAAGTYTNGQIFDGWTLASNANNQVSVINDPVLANTGTNLLALADGQFRRILPTVAGRTYRLNYAYRGPGAVAWWRGEGNFVDSVGGHNGTPSPLPGTVGFSPGEVGQAFAIRNVGPAISRIEVPDGPDFMLTNSLSIEGWIRAQAPTGGILTRTDDRASFDPWSLFLDANNLTFRIEDQGGASAIASTPLVPGQWCHVAGTLDSSSGRLQLYTNGTLAVQTDTPIRPFGTLDTNLNPKVHIGLGFGGDIDEISLYSRALSASEAKAIYRAGPTGKFDPAVAGAAGLAKARLILGAGQTNVFFGNNEVWRTNSITFTASQNGTPLEIEGLEPGMLLDTFTLAEIGTATSYYLPEESLNALIGDDAQGLWTLEVWDTRVGAALLVPRIVSWQLNLAFENRVPLARPLRHAEAICDSLPPNAIHYFFVDVPLWASFATNSLTNATAPLNLIYNANGLPRNGVLTDFALLTGVPDGVATLSTTSIPPLRVGNRYYLAVQNPANAAADYCLSVEFDITKLTNAISLVATQAALRPRYYAFDVSSNAAAVVFQTFNADGDVDMVLRYGTPLPDLSSYDYISTNTGTNDEFILVVTNSSPVNLAPGRWYAGVFNQDPAPVNYTIRATELLAIDPILIGFTLTNDSLCLTWASVPTFRYHVVGKVELTDEIWVPVSPTIVATDITTTYCIPLPTPYRFFQIRVGPAPAPPDPDDDVDIPPGGIVYFAIPVPDWPYAATNTLVSATLPVDLLFNQNGLPVGAGPGDFTLLANTNAGVFTLMTNTTPPLARNRTYYLGIRNPNPTTVTARLRVEFNVTRLTNAVPLSDTLLSTIPRYFTMAVPPDSAAAFFQIYNLTTNVDLVIREEGYGIPTLTSHDYASTNPGTAGDGILVATNSTPFPLTATNWVLSVLNRTAGQAGYTVRASVSSNANPDIIRFEMRSNELCLIWHSIPGLSYYIAGKIDLNEPNWTPVSPTIVASGFITTNCIPLPTPYMFFQVRVGIAPTPIVPDPDVPVVIPPNDVAYFIVPVADWPYAATNTVVTANLPVDLIFNQNVLPTGATPGDVTLLTGTSGGVSTLLTNGTPPLLTNRNYYLALRNTNPVPATVSLRVEFNTTFLNSGLAVSDTLLSTIPRYFSFLVPPGSGQADFELLNLTTNSDLVVREVAFPSLTTFDYGSFNQGTTNELITVTSASLPPLTTNVWNLSVFNRTIGTAGYTVRATITNSNPVIVGTQISPTNLCLTWTSIPGSNYYVAGKVELTATNWVPVSPVIVATSNLTTYCVVLPNSNHFFTVIVGTPPVVPLPPSGPPILLPPQISTTNICLTWSSIPGTNYYVVGKVELSDTNWVPVSPTITATSTQTTYCVTLPNSNRFFSIVVGTRLTPPTTPPVISNPQISNTNICLTWNSTVGANYQVVGKADLNDTNWVPVSPILTATSTQTTHCVTLPNTNRFFSVVASTAPVTPPPPTGPPVILGTQFSATNLCFTWSSIPGSNYYAAGKVDLNNTNWVPVSPVITATSTQTTHCVTLPSTNQFFAIVAGGVANPPAAPPAFTSIATVGAGGLQLNWTAPVTARFQVQWSLVVPTANWNTFPPIITPSATNAGLGTFSFTDDGSQSGGLGAQRFYQLLQLP